MKTHLASGSVPGTFNVKCVFCDGTGKDWLRPGTKCPACKGKGIHEATR